MEYEGTGDTTYTKSETPPTDAGTYKVIVTIKGANPTYAGAGEDNFEIKQKEVTVTAKDKNINIGDTIPDLSSPTEGTDYTVTGLIGDDTLGGTIAMAYTGTPGNTAGTYPITISGATVGDNYIVTHLNGTLTIAQVWTVTFNSQGGSAGAQIRDAADGTTIAKPADPTRSDYRFGGWYKEAACTNAWNFATDTVTEDMTLFAKWTKTGGSGGSSGSSGSSSDKKKDIDVEVNGKKQESLGQAETKYQKGQKVTTVKINEEKLAQKLTEEGKGSTVTIPLENEKGTVRGELNGQMVKNMEQEEAVLEIKTAKAGYTLPAEQIKIDEVSQKLGQEVELKDIKVTVEIGETPQEMVQVVENTAKKDEYTLVVPPVDFTVNCSYGDKTVEAKSFSNYVARTIAIPEGIDPSKITTGLIAYPDGTTCHVPTKVIVINGKYYAKINSLTNSTYTIIWNPKAYQDVQGHWAQEVCNEMGARKVVAEATSTTFKPDEPITRLFFTQTLVRALGLGDKGTEYRFSDVDHSKPYFGAVATGIEYGLVKGYQDNTFKAFNNVTREEASALILRAMKIAGLKTDYTQAELQNELDKFVDKDEIGTWAREVVAICVKNGLIVGNERDEFMPKGKITKAELAAIMMRMLEKAELI